MDFWTAYHFLTTLPGPGGQDLPEGAFGRSMAFFPAVGLVIGGLLALGAALFGWVFSPGVTGALVLAEWVLLTGALHLDGFLDCCDGLPAAKPPEDRLSILRDVHAGSFAVAGGVVLLVVKYAALTSALSAGRFGLPLLAAAPVVSRWAMVYAAVAYPYARPGGSLGGLFALHVGHRSLVVAGVSAAAFAVALAGWQGAAALGLASAVAALFARWTMTRIPGLTGDVYGAINELAEVAVLLLAAGLVWGGAV